MRLQKIVSVMLILALVVMLLSSCECGAPAKSDVTVKINEVMFNPFDEDAGNEWIELVNSDVESHNIKEWTISNRAGDTIATLPEWNLPPGSYLQIVFGTGIDDSDFTDGTGVVHTQGNLEVLDNTEDEVALYAGVPKAATIIDFVSWCSDGDYNRGEAHNQAVKAKQWTEGSFFDMGYPSGKSMVSGFSLGRNGNSADTDSPDDWARNGGIDAYFDTPGLTNTGPYFTTDWGIKLTQTKMNLLLIQFGHQVTHASHEALSERQSPEESYIKAEHTFTTTYAGYEDTFTGVGEYHWTRVSPQEWQDEINISLTNSAGDEEYSLNYTRDYKDTGLSLIITENLDGIYSYEVFDKEEVLPDVDATLEPLPEAPTHTEQKGIYDSTITTITQVALGEYRVETISNKDLAFRDEKQVLSFTKDYKILTDNKLEATTELEITSDSREDMTISTAYVMDTDVGWHQAHDLGNINTTYSKYDLRVGEQSYSLVEPGYYRMTKRPGKDYYDIDLSLMLGDGESFEIGCSGYIERVVEAGEVIYRGKIADSAGVKEWQFYIDGWESAVGGGICAIAGGLIGLIWIGIGSVIGGGIGAAACGSVGAAIESATEPDTTKPTIEWEILDSGSDKEKGWLKVKVTVSDDTEVSDWSVKATSEEGRTLTNRSYEPGSESDSKTYPLYNRHCTKRTITITVSVTDSSGNTRSDSRQFDVPARICTPNVEETEPADEDVSVPVDSKTEATFCKPMDTTATEGAFSFSPHVDFTISWSDYNTVATLTPTQPLEYGTTYTVTISTEALSFAGYPLEEPYTFSFTTEEAPVAPEPPEVLDTLPPDGAEEVSLDTELQIIFSKPMDEATTAEALIIFPEAEYEIFWGEDNQVMLIHPSLPWEPAAIYEVTITSDAMSEDGLYMEEDYTFVFFTAEI